MFDALLLVRDGATLGSLAGAGVDTTDALAVYESPVRGMTFRAGVPDAEGTDPTLDITIQLADSTVEGSFSDLISFAQITAAGDYSVHAAVSKRYVRAYNSLGGTSPDFGDVTIGVSPGQVREWNA